MTTNKPEVKRYDYGYTDDGKGGARYLGLIPRHDGKLVRYEDYETLQAEYRILESELATVKKVAYGNNGEQGGEWVRSDERLPTEADVDCYGTIIGWDSIHDQAVTMYPMAIKHRKGITHWKPTGLKRPQPPKEGE